MPEVPPLEETTSSDSEFEFDTAAIGEAALAAGMTGGRWLPASEQGSRIWPFMSALRRPGGFSVGQTPYLSCPIDDFGRMS